MINISCNYVAAFSPIQHQELLYEIFCDVIKILRPLNFTN